MTNKEISNYFLDEFEKDEEDNEMDDYSRGFCAALKAVKEVLKDYNSEAFAQILNLDTLDFVISLIGEM